MHIMNSVFMIFLQYDAITGFCQSTKEYCPPGPAGIPGQPGLKGPRGGK